MTKTPATMQNPDPSYPTKIRRHIRLQPSTDGPTSPTELNECSPSQSRSSVSDSSSTSHDPVPCTLSYPRSLKMCPSNSQPLKRFPEPRTRLGRDVVAGFHVGGLALSAIRGNLADLAWGTDPAVWRVIGEQVYRCRWDLDGLGRSGRSVGFITGRSMHVLRRVCSW